jgi:pSer/pThr/pTyr-binding forkhead associated (FHA) protein
MTSELSSTQSLVPFNNSQAAPRKTGATQSLPQGLPARVKFLVSEGRALFEFATAEPIIVGRSSSTTAVNLDLSPYNAADLGISRSHARIEVFGDRLMIKDLGSVNGTRLNGTLLTPNFVYELQHGDELKLGRLKMRVYFVYA